MYEVIHALLNILLVALIITIIVVFSVGVVQVIINTIKDRKR